MTSRAGITPEIGAGFEDVLARCQAGDGDAFAVLWRNLQPALVRYLRVIAREGPDDLASETWLEVARGIGRFEGDERGFRSWVFSIARHRHIDACRRQARRPPIDWRTAPDQAASQDVAATVLEAFSTDAALALISSLPPDQAEAIALRVIADLDVARVAEIMGREPGSVRVLTHRGLRRLAERLTGSEPEQDRASAQGA